MQTMVPEGYSGGVAEIADSFQRQSKSRATFYYIYSSNEIKIENALSKSAYLSEGQGAKLTAVNVVRSAPAQPLNLVVKAVSYNPMPFASMLSNKKNLSIEEQLTFTPEQGKKYIVRGVLNAEEQVIWVEEYLGKKVAQIGDWSDESTQVNSEDSPSSLEKFKLVRAGDPKEYVLSVFGKPDTFSEKGTNYLTGKAGSQTLTYEGLGTIIIDAPNKYDFSVKEVIVSQ